MITFKYHKINNAVYIPHLDMLRAVTRTLRRINAQVEYSAGFNPHMIMYFSAPLGIPTASLCEYCTVATNYSDDFVDRFNSNCIDGIKILQAHEVTKNPNIAAAVTAAEYLIEVQSADKHINQIEKIKDNCIIDGKDHTKNIYSIQLYNADTIKVKIACGNNNMRADKLAQHIETTLDLQTNNIMRINMFAKDQNIDDYIKQFYTKK